MSRVTREGFDRLRAFCAMASRNVVQDNAGRTAERARAVNFTFKRFVNGRRHDPLPPIPALRVQQYGGHEHGAHDEHVVQRQHLKRPVFAM